MTSTTVVPRQVFVLFCHGVHKPCLPPPTQRSPKILGHPELWMLGSSDLLQITAGHRDYVVFSFIKPILTHYCISVFSKASQGCVTVCCFVLFHRYWGVTGPMRFPHEEASASARTYD